MFVDIPAMPSSLEVSLVYSEQPDRRREKHTRSVVCI